METYPQYPQTATDNVPSEGQGQVAPTQPTQPYVSVPGQAPVQESYQPVDPNTQVEPQASPAPTVDYQAQLRELEAERTRLRQQNEQYGQVFQQIKQHTEQESAEKERNERIQAIVSTAESMTPGEASTYMRNQMINMQRQEGVAREQAIQRERMQAQQMITQAVMPQYADHIIQSLGLPAEAKQELLSLGDTELMYRQGPALKARYDQMEQLRQQVNQSTQQQSRSNEVNAMRQNGLTSIGGQAASGFNPNELPSDPTEKAQVLYEQMMARRAGPR